MKAQREALTTRETVTMHLVDAEGNRGPVQVEMGYDPTDPFAIRFTFLTPQPVIWSFARDLLAAGIYEPIGDGDVHVWPSLSTDGSAVVIIELSSPDGSIMVESSLRDVAAFVRRMHACVAPGTESAHLNIDAALSEFFASQR